VKRQRVDVVRQQQLDEVIAEYLEAVDAGRRPDPDEWLARFPDLAGPLAIFFADQRQVRGLLAPLGTLAGPPAGALRSFGDYELLEEVARGGMGVVYRARQRSLNRVVALKRILAGRLASAEEVSRFRYEAELAANLDHPGVVPIYEVGEHDGHPYFTMKFIEGGSLAQQAPRFRGDPRAAARLVAAVARAVHHAHQHGLLHRDLKPANVLLDAEGQPHLTDFGLARRLSGGQGLTRTGTAVGTPSYMAPEQATGQAVTTAADVYSLGAILYELLVGAPPFRAPHPLETLRQAQEQEPVRPRAVNPKVARDLETVCLKCLEKGPDRRYAGADDLAEDLDRFLRGEPVRGRRVRLAGQLWRWCRRRPLPAGLAAGLVLSVVAGLGLVTWQWRRAEANFLLAEAERRRAEGERIRADEGFQEAHRAVQEFYTRVSEGKLRDVPGAQAVRKELLEAALAYYERFLRERGQDTTLRAELAEAHLRIGLLTGALGSSPRALAACRQALAMYRDMLRDDPTSVPLRRWLAFTLTRIGFHQSHTGEVAAALDSLAEARGLYEALRRERPDDPVLRDAVADVLTATANAQAKAGRVAAAIESFDQARRIQEELNRRSPGDIRGKERLATYCLNLAGVHRPAGHRAEAARFTRQARDLLEELVQADPGNFSYRRHLASACRLLAAGLPPADALPLAERAHALLAQLCELEPGAVILQAELAPSHRVLGHIYLKMRRQAEALAEYEKALAVMQRVVRQQPEMTDFQSQLGRCHFDLGHARWEMGNLARAHESFTRARDIRQALVKANPQNIDYRTDLGVTLINMSGTLAELGRKEEALEAARQSVREHQTVFAAVPQIPRYRAALTHALKGRARFALENDRPAEAVSTALELKKLWPANGSELYEAARILGFSAAAAGKISGQSPGTPDAERYAGLAVATLREAAAAGLPEGARPGDEPAFTCLRGRSDFREFLAGLAEAARERKVRPGDGSPAAAQRP
jgi:eukaryotic-like serine/threonine-protein kinase